MIKRGFAFEKLFHKKIATDSMVRRTIRPTVSFYALRARPPVRTSGSENLQVRRRTSRFGEGLSGPAANKPSLIRPKKGRDCSKLAAWRPKLKNRTFQSVRAVASPLLKTGLGVVLVLLIYFVFGSNFFTLSSLTIQGNRLVDAPLIEKTVFKNGFHQINALFFNEAKAARQILSLAQIKNVEFHKHLLQHKLEILVVEHETSLIWQTAGQRFLVNRAGVAYDVAPPESPLMMVEDLKNVPVNLKQQILTTEFIEFANFVSANLSRKTAVNVRQMVVPETTFELEVITNEGWKIIFDTSKSPDTQLNNLSKILKGGAKPKQYVDLRILDRIYYK